MKILLLLVSLSLTTYIFAQEITIGTAPMNPPFAMVADTNIRFFGFDIEIMMEICKRIQRQCKFTPIVFGEILANVKAGTIDLGMAAIILTPNLQSGGWLPSLPYLESSARFLTLSNSKITNLNDISTKRVGTKEGTLFLRFVQGMYNNNVTVRTYSTVMEMLEALQKKEIDVILTDGPDAEYWVANNSGTYKLIGDKLPIGAGYTIVALPSNAPLMQQINQALLNMESDGSYITIYNKYFTFSVN